MSALLISYDLNSPGQDYSKVINAIKNLGPTKAVLKSSWIVITSLTPSQAWDKLKPVVDTGDHVFIVDITRSARQGWLPKNTWDWINQNV